VFQTYFAAREKKDTSSDCGLLLLLTLLLTRQDKGRNYVSKRASDSVHTVVAHRVRETERKGVW
jgi:hypothetical protein